MAEGVVLIIDDEIDFNLMMKYYLENKGFQVYCCDNLDEGLRSIETHKPAIIISGFHSHGELNNVIQDQIDSMENYTPVLHRVRREPTHKGEDALVEQIKRIIKFLKDKIKL